MAVCGAAVLHTVIGVTFMNRSYQQIPQILKGKVIAFTGSYPGVGKSYTYRFLDNQLREEGYNVIHTGSTQKAAANIGGRTVASQSLDFRNNFNIRANKSGTIGHNKTSAFYMIDEAFITDQQKFSEIKAAYPNCCFILFGDPMQFEPASGNSPITQIDLLFNLTKMMRVKDPELLDAIKTVKEGRIPYQFLYSHCDNKMNDNMLILCYKNITSSYSNIWPDKPGTLYRSNKIETYIDEDGIEQRSVLHDICNGDLWRLIEIKDNKYTLSRISGDRKVITIDEELWHLHFTKRNALNCHKIQGDTIRKEASDIVIFFRDLIKEPQTMLRFLYVALSRAEYGSQIHIPIEDLRGLEQDFKYSGPLHNYLDGVKAIETSSPELCATESILNSLILPNINDLKRVLNADDNQYYNMQYRPHLVQGKIKSEFQHAEDLRKTCTVDIHYDQALTRRLRSSINKREIWSIPGKGDCFITANKCSKGCRDAGSAHEMNWFVFEIDELPDEVKGKLDVKTWVEKQVLDSSVRAIYKDIKNYCFRVIYSGNKSYHFWIYVENMDCNREHYKKVHNYLNNLIFMGYADKSINTPEHLVRAPGKVRPDTGNEQKLVSFKGSHTIFINNIENIWMNDDLVAKQSEAQASDLLATPRYDETSSNLVEQAFNMYKDDIPTTNGGRGQKILSKLYKEFYRGFLDKSQLKELASMLCTYANCKEKISKMYSYINEM